MKACPGRRCLDVDHNPTMIPDLAAACPRHLADLARTVNDMPATYRELDALLGGQDDTPLGSRSTPSAVVTAGLVARPAQGDRVTASRSAPIPMNVSARALQEDMLAVTRMAEDAHRRAKRGHAASRNLGRELPTLRARCAYVAGWLADILTLPVADDFVVEVLRIRQVSRAVLQSGRLVHRLPAPCPECDSMGLCREDGASWVKCSACGLAFGEDEYDRLVLILADYNRPTRGKS